MSNGNHKTDEREGDWAPWEQNKDSPARIQVGAGFVVPMLAYHHSKPSQTSTTTRRNHLTTIQPWLFIPAVVQSPFFLTQAFVDCQETACFRCHSPQFLIRSCP